MLLLLVGVVVEAYLKLLGKWNLIVFLPCLMVRLLSGRVVNVTQLLRMYRFFDEPGHSQLIES